MTDEIILHHFFTSPLSEKVRLRLGIKALRNLKTPSPSPAASCEAFRIARRDSRPAMIAEVMADLQLKWTASAACSTGAYGCRHCATERSSLG